ncbi:autotransporter assembly complex family protein, partial [Thermodesulfobacteriota bacterium]
MSTEKNNFLIFGIVFFIVAMLSLSYFKPHVFAGEPGIFYNVNIYGIEDKKLLSDMKTYIDLIRFKDRPIQSLQILKRRAEGDKEKIFKMLKAKGYFKAEIDIDINHKESPVTVSVKINTGSRFLLKSISIKTTETHTHDLANIPDSKNTGLLPGKPFQSDAVLEGRQRLILSFKKIGFPFVEIEKYEVTADHMDNTVSVTYIIDTGPKAVFGETTFEGLESVDQPYVFQKLVWKQGDTYNIDLVKKTHGRLTGLGLFSIVRIVEGKRLDEKGRLPITIELKERMHKSIGAGIFYKTDEGPGIKSMWENRNIMGKGERLTTSIELSDFTLAAEGIFRKPDFYRKDQIIRLALRIAEDHPNAYKSTYLETMAIIERKLSDHVDIGGGLAYKSSTIEQLSSSNSFSLFSVPVFSRWDNTDDLLDPGKGNRISIEATPFYNTSGSQSKFIKSFIDFRYYLSLLQSPSLKLAANLTIGSIYGASSHEIPADERFYAGGGGSVRGYAYQSIGPYSNGNPYGGKSLIAISFEPRIRLSDKFGLVFFIDGGTAYSGKILSSSENILWGVGAGLRYYTPIGPLRMDIGFPLNRRKGI